MSTSDTDSAAPTPSGAGAPAGWGGDTRVEITASSGPLVTFNASEHPDVSIITVTYGISPAQPRVWAGFRASAADLTKAEMIVVDNPHPWWGHAGADLVAVGSAGVHLLRADENLGFGGGNNLGVDRAGSDMICLLNPDVIIAPGDLPRLLALAKQHPHDVIAPILMNDDGSVQEMGGRISRDGTTRQIRDATEPDAATPDYASAACWVLHRDLFVELGGFDPIFHPAYYEDVDFALRLHARGGRTLIDHSTRLVHAWAPHHRRFAPDTRPQHRLLRERWADELATRPTLRKPRATSGRSRTKRSSPSPTKPR